MPGRMTRTRSAAACVWSSLWSVSVAALAVHAAVYRTFWPGNPGHSYLGWYEVAVGALSALATGALVLLPLRRLVRERRGAVRPPRPAEQPLAKSLAAIVPASIAVFVLQESIERSVESGGLELASCGGAAWLVALAVAALAASVIHLVRRSYGALVARIAAPRTHASATPPGCSPRRARTRRPSPLASGRALRAPPLLAL